MADFGGTILTNLGRNLLAKALTGAQLTFTKVQLGDGVWDSSISPENLTSLISPKIDLPIQDLQIMGDGTAMLRVVLTNTGLQEGFFTRELGIFAQDPDLGEILYAVAYAQNPDFIPADGVTKVENVIDIITVVSNAQNVSAIISDTVILATKEDIHNHNQDINVHQDIRNALLQKANADLSNISSLGKILDLDGLGSGLDADLVRGLPADFSFSFGNSGYQKLPSGLIIQWGTATITNDPANPQIPTYIPLPIAFPAAGLVVVASDVGDGRHSVGISFKDNATLQAWSYDPINNQYPTATGILWIAIGY